jgi:hypothetical protein
MNAKKKNCRDENADGERREASNKKEIFSIAHQLQ